MTIRSANPARYAALICIGGLPATGKSTVADLLVRFHLPQAQIVCPDRTRLELLNREPGGMVTDPDLDPAITDRVILRMLEKTGALLRSDATVIVPSAFVRETMRQAFEHMAVAASARFHAVWLNAPLDLLHTRARARQNAQDAFNASAVGPDFIKPSLIEGAIAWPYVDASRPAAEVAADVARTCGLRLTTPRL